MKTNRGPKNLSSREGKQSDRVTASTTATPCACAGVRSNTDDGDGLLDIFPLGMCGGIDGDDKPSVATHRTIEISANFWFGPHLPGVLCPLKHPNAMDVMEGE